MLAHLKSYLRQSSIHGLRHLVDQEDNAVLVRLVWAIALTATFLILPVVICNSQQDYSAAPVATTSDFIPIQVGMNIRHYVL